MYSRIPNMIEKNRQKGSIYAIRKKNKGKESKESEGATTIIAQARPGCKSLGETRFPTI